MTQTKAGAKTGRALPGCYDVLVQADKEVPNRLFITAIQAVVGDLEKLMGRWHYRLTHGEDVASLDVWCTDDQWEIALQCDRWFGVSERLDRVNDLPPDLRMFGHQMVRTLRELEAAA